MTRRRRTSLPGDHALRDELEPLVGLHHGQPTCPRAGVAVELARAHQHPAVLGQAAGQGPRVAVGAGAHR